jgi:hypothetical protein
VPTTEDPNFQLIFTEKIGVYFSFDMKNVVVKKNAISSKYTGSADPKVQFAVESSFSTCTPEIRGAASYLLGALRAYFAAPSAALVPEGVSIQEHDDKARWFEIGFDDVMTGFTVRACANVGVLTPDRASGLGIESPLSAGSIGYASSIGLFEPPK